MKRSSAVVLAGLLAAGMLAGCGDSASSSKTDTAAAANSASSKADTAVSEAAAPAATAVKEVDFMSPFLGGSGTNYLSMNLADLNKDTGDAFAEANASEFDKSFGQATYSLGELDSVFCGRAKFGGKLPVSCTLYLDGDRIKQIMFTIDEGDGSVKSADVCKSISECLKASLPKDYNGEYDYKPAGKDSARFANTVDGYVFEVKHSSLDDTGYPVRFTMESYKDKYGIKE